MGQLWEAASVLALQAALLGWRINRESSASEKGDPTWLPVADIINLLAMAVSVFCVFLAPILGLWATTEAVRSFGIVLILTVGHGHLAGRALRAFQYWQEIARLLPITGAGRGRRNADAALIDIVANRFDAGIRPDDRVERDMIAVPLGGKQQSTKSRLLRWCSALAVPRGEPYGD